MSKIAVVYWSGTGNTEYCFMEEKKLFAWATSFLCV